MLRQLRQEFHKNSTISSIFTQLRQNLHMLHQNLHILGPCQVETCFSCSCHSFCLPESYFPIIAHGSICSFLTADLIASLGSLKTEAYSNYAYLISSSSSFSMS